MTSVPDWGTKENLEATIQSWMCVKRFKAVEAYDLSNQILFRKI
jgi:hypothetical protein